MMYFLNLLKLSEYLILQEILEEGNGFQSQPKQQRSQLLTCVGCNLQDTVFQHFIKW